jgi:hypothetical protein
MPGVLLRQGLAEYLSRLYLNHNLPISTSQIAGTALLDPKPCLLDVCFLSIPIESFCKGKKLEIRKIIFSWDSNRGSR